MGHRTCSSTMLYVSYGIYPNCIQYLIIKATSLRRVCPPSTCTCTAESVLYQNEANDGVSCKPIMGLHLEIGLRPININVNFKIYS